MGPRPRRGEGAAGSLCDRVETDPIGEPPACSYYCGPGASMAGKSFNRRHGRDAVDLAGDPLC